MEEYQEVKPPLMKFLNLYLKGLQNDMNYGLINLQILEQQSNQRWLVSDQNISLIAIFSQSLQDQVQESMLIQLVDWEFQLQFTNKTHHLEVLIRVQNFKTIKTMGGTIRNQNNIKQGSKDHDIQEQILLNKKNLLRKHFQFQITQKQLSQKKSLINFIQNDKYQPDIIYLTRQLDQTKLYIIIKQDKQSPAKQPIASYPTQTEASFPDTLNIHQSQKISQTLFQQNHISDKSNIGFVGPQNEKKKEFKIPKAPTDQDKRKILEDSVKIEDNMNVIKIEARGRPYKTVNNKIWSNKPIIPYDQKLKKEQRIYGSYDQIYNSDAQKKLLNEGNKQHFYDHNMWKRRVGKRASYQKRNGVGNDREMEIEIKDDDEDVWAEKIVNNNNGNNEEPREPRRSDNNKARIIQNLYKKKKRSPHRSYIIVSEAESDSDASRSRSRKKKGPNFQQYNYEGEPKFSQSKKEETNRVTQTQQSGYQNDARHTQKESTYYQDDLESIQASNSVKFIKQSTRNQLISQ